MHLSFDYECIKPSVKVIKKPVGMYFLINIRHTSKYSWLIKVTFCVRFVRYCKSRFQITASPHVSSV